MLGSTLNVSSAADTHRPLYPWMQVLFFLEGGEISPGSGMWTGRPGRRGGCADGVRGALAQRLPGEGWKQAEGLGSFSCPESGAHLGKICPTPAPPSPATLGSPVSHLADSGVHQQSPCRVTPDHSPLLQATFQSCP